MLLSKDQTETVALMKDGDPSYRKLGLRTVPEKTPQDVPLMPRPSATKRFGHSTIHRNEAGIEAYSTKLDGTRSVFKKRMMRRVSEFIV